MRLLVLALHALLVGFISAQTLSTSTSPFITGGHASSASAASTLSVMALETSISATDAGRGSLTSTNPASVTQSDFGHASVTSSQLSSVAPAQSTAGNGHQSASQLGTSTGASATPTGSSTGNRAIVLEGAGALLAAVALLMALM